MSQIIARLREPSTVTGIVALLGVAGIAVPVEIVQYLGMCVVGAASLFDILRKEKVQ